MLKFNVVFEPAVDKDKATTEVAANQPVITLSNKAVEGVKDGLSYKFTCNPAPAELFDRQEKVVDTIVDACLGVARVQRHKSAYS